MNQGIKRLFKSDPEIHFVSTQDIDHDDRRYATIPEWWRNPRLDRSIQEIGIVNPVRVQKRRRSYRVVSGYQRTAAARRLAIARIPCVLVDDAESLTLFLQALWENIGSRELHELEKARALTLLRRTFGVGEAELIESYLPVLGIKSNRYHLNRLLQLDSLPETLKKASVEDGLLLDHALKLVNWRPEEQAATLEIVRKLRPGRNKQRILLDLLDDLRVLLKASVVEILNNASNAVQDERAHSARRLDQTIEYLRRRKYPRLSEHEDRYWELRGQLSIPPSIQLNPPSFFEGTDLSFSFSASSPRELDQITLKLRELTARPEIYEIFNLL